MGWRAKGEPLSGVGGVAVQRVEHDGGQTAEIRGSSPAVVQQLVELVERGEDDLAKATLALATGDVGYWVTFCLGVGQYGNTHVTIPAPGIQHAGHLMQLTKDLSDHFGLPLVVLSWTQIDAPPAIEIARLTPPAPPKLVLHKA